MHPFAWIQFYLQLPGLGSFIAIITVQITSTTFVALTVRPQPGRFPVDLLQAPSGKAPKYSFSVLARLCSIYLGSASAPGSVSQSGES